MQTRIYREKYNTYLVALYNFDHLKKFKNWLRPLFRSRTDHACPHKPNLSRETVPLKWRIRIKYFNFILVENYLLRDSPGTAEVWRTQCCTTTWTEPTSAFPSAAPTSSSPRSDILGSWFHVCSCIGTNRAKLFFVADADLSFWWPKKCKTINNKNFDTCDADK
jgi:hypothetical protein